MIEAIREAAATIQSRVVLKPEVGVILGSGLGPFGEQVEEAIAIPYSDIPHFVTPTVQGHAGRLLVGKVRGKPVAVMQGRFHYYEGHPMATVVLPTRVLGALGIHTLVVTNAAGGVNESFHPGDLMLITDHVNLMGTNPLIGGNIAELGPRFPDMTRAYHPDCLQLLREVAARQGVGLREGIYMALTGPSYETPAEIRMFRGLGADAVGMSTVPEVIAANHLGLRVAGISCITNMAAGITGQPLTHDEVTETANEAMMRFIHLLVEAIGLMGQV
ncbi:MAG: purine-nucleoside phosphorylase [Bradymonadales bacterium]|nr:purine-nucleoside phosphorylase [Bradymonadales bacterium]